MFLELKTRNEGGNRIFHLDYITSGVKRNVSWSTISIQENIKIKIMHRDTHGLIYYDILGSTIKKIRYLMCTLSFAITRSTTMHKNNIVSYHLFM